MSDNLVPFILICVILPVGFGFALASYIKSFGVN